MGLQNRKQKRKRKGAHVATRKAVETVINGVKHVKRVPNVPNHSTAHPLYQPPVSNLGKIPQTSEKK